jgi:response regulator RpfG family c-di-GMP phosphodiesterase
MADIAISKGFMASLGGIAFVVTTTWAIIQWANTNYASADDFRQYKDQTTAQFKYQGLVSEETALRTEISRLEDKVFELTLKKNNKKATPEELTVLERTEQKRKELQRTLERIQEAKRGLNTQYNNSLSTQR